MFIIQIELVILDSPTVITTKQIDRVIVSFDLNVNKIEQCWINTNVIGQPF
jgi:hypothetical protein